METSFNPMYGRVEARYLVAVSYEKQKLIDWYNGQLADEMYRDNDGSHNWSKWFKKGTHLEWFNRCESFDCIYTWGHGIEYEWAELDKYQYLTI